jgi:GrpB-like predicted nucleotidyltransferase (UPF0157 family)
MGRWKASITEYRPARAPRAEKYSSSVPTPAEITRHYEWEPPQGEEIWVDGGPNPEPITVVVHDPAWPQLFAVVADRIRAALGERVIELDHIGSTAVPGLPAKPVIDIDLTIVDSADEASYVPALESAGFRFVLRERGWHEHRLLTSDDPRTNLHVFSPDCPEVIRHRLFRDWLIEHPDDQALYRDVKLESAAASTAAGEHGMEYNLRKQPVIREIYDRMFRAHGLI